MTHDSIAAVTKDIDKRNVDGYAPPYEKQQRATLLHLENPRIEILITLIKQRATFEHIAGVLDIKKERVHQLVACLIAEHGEEVFAPDQPIMTVAEAALQTGVSVSTINSLCRNGKIPSRRRSSAASSAYLLTQESLAIIRQRGERTCVICARIFMHEPGKGRTCSNVCGKKYAVQRREKLCAQNPTLGTLRGVRRDVWLRLQVHVPPQQETCLTLLEACRKTGLTKMQIRWLALRKIITAGEHPTKRWRGRPITVYAVSELEIVKEVYEAS
jgi:hypothetical protein